MAGVEGLTRPSGPRPSGSLREFKIAPGNFVEPSAKFLILPSGIVRLLPAVVILFKVL